MSVNELLGMSDENKIALSKKFKNLNLQDSNIDKIKECKEKTDNIYLEDKTKEELCKEIRKYALLLLLSN